MKKTLILLFVFTLPTIIFSQSDNTLFGGPNKLKITGVFGGVSLTYLEQDLFQSPIDQNGFWGFEIANNFDLSFRRISRPTDKLVFGTNEALDIRTRGVQFGYRPFEDKVIHPSLAIYVSKGSLESREIDIKDHILMLQPKAGFEINTFRFMKTSLLLGYNFINGVDLFQYNNENFSRMSLELNFKFGGFWE
jgi:hypothetical protein